MINNVTFLVGGKKYGWSNLSGNSSRRVMHARDGLERWSAIC